MAASGLEHLRPISRDHHSTCPIDKKPALKPTRDPPSSTRSIPLVAGEAPLGVDLDHPLVGAASSPLLPTPVEQQRALTASRLLRLRPNGAAPASRQRTAFCVCAARAGDDI